MMAFMIVNECAWHVPQSGCCIPYIYIMEGSVLLQQAFHLFKLLAFVEP